MKEKQYHPTHGKNTSKKRMGRKRVWKANRLIDKQILSFQRIPALLIQWCTPTTPGLTGLQGSPVVQSCVHESFWYVKIVRSRGTSPAICVP